MKDGAEDESHLRSMPSNSESRRPVVRQGRDRGPPSCFDRQQAYHLSLFRHGSDTILVDCGFDATRERSAITG